MHYTRVVFTISRITWRVQGVCLGSASREESNCLETRGHCYERADLLKRLEHALRRTLVPSPRGAKTPERRTVTARTTRSYELARTLTSEVTGERYHVHVRRRPWSRLPSASIAALSPQVTLDLDEPPFAVSLRTANQQRTHCCPDLRIGEGPAGSCGVRAYPFPAGIWVGRQLSHGTDLTPSHVSGWGRAAVASVVL